MVSPRILVISGSMGAGKTTVMAEASDLLMARAIHHAAVDLDAISLPMLPEPISRLVHFRNVTAIANNCREAGIDTFLLAAAIESGGDIAELRKAFNADVMTIARLIAPRETMAARLRMREPGMRQAEFLERSRHLDRLLTASALEDFTVANDDQSITDVARELLERAGWIK